MRLKMVNKTVQSGRTMIEMLGVIAIIGLLSVGAFLGYRTALDSYRAVSIQDIILKGKMAVETSKRSATASTLQHYVQKTSLVCAGNTDCASMSEEVLGGRAYKSFNIYSNETKGVCEKLQSRSEIFNQEGIEIYPAKCETNTVRMRFSFSFAPATYTGNDSGIDPGDEALKSGYACEVNADCPTARPVCKNSRCSVCTEPKSRYDADVDACVCPKGRYGNDCVPCNQPKEWDGTDCICPNGGHGTYCSTCELPHVWNGNTCACPEGTYGENCVYCQSPREWRNNQCVCPEDEWKGLCVKKCPENTVRNEETGACVCPDGTYGEYCETCGEPFIWIAETQECACPPDKDAVNGTCVDACPNGMVRLNGTCVCDVSKGFKQTPQSGKCVCADNMDFLAPDGSRCYACEQTTREWCRQNMDTTQVNCDTINENVWSCYFFTRVKIDAEQWRGMEYGEAYYNPSTANYCDFTEVLVKSGNTFECAPCDRVRENGVVETDGKCVCSAGETYENGKCVSPCAVGEFAYQTEEGITCSKCAPWFVYLNGTCHDEKEGSLCQQENGVAAGADGYREFWWGLWKQNTPSSCRQNKNISPSGSGICSWDKGCQVVESNLPYCSYNTKITTLCQCDTGGSIGQYCCPATAYADASGCHNCPDGSMANADKTGCETLKCAPYEVAQNGKCRKVCSENERAVCNSLGQCSCGHCPVGTYMADISGLCPICPQGTTSDGIMQECVACPSKNIKANAYCRCSPDKWDFKSETCNN